MMVGMITLVLTGGRAGPFQKIKFAKTIERE
jgi:hypothetical protein